MTDVWQSITSALRAVGPSPMVTWLAPMGSIELSGTTYFNGVSKAANFLVDGLMIDAHTAVAVELGNHWQSPVWLSAVFAAGCHVSDVENADFVVTFCDELPAVRDGKTFIAVSRHPFGVPDVDVPVDVVNGSLEVRNFGDYYAGPSQRDEVLVSDAHCEIRSDHALEVITEIFAAKNVMSGQRISLAGHGSVTDRVIWQVLAPVFGQCSVVLLDGVPSDSPMIAAEKIAVAIAL
ncbi:MAG: TIGR03089 family protein [Actinomycetes bacterium]